MPSLRQFVYVTGLFLLLIAAAYHAAGIQAAEGAKSCQLGLTLGCVNGFPQPLGNPLKGSSPHNFDYFMTINAIAVSIALLIPAMALFVLRRPGGPGPVWLMFWTAANLAFLIHLYAGVFGIFGGDWRLIFHDVTTPPRVTHPNTDVPIAIWWTLDVVLAWAVTYRPHWVQLERGLLHIFIFASAVMSSVVLSSNGYVRWTGAALLVITLFWALYRVVVYPFDASSFAGRLYVWTFQGLNLIAPWYRLSTWPGVLNLGALRVVLRQKNLHNTSDIPITRPEGVLPPVPFEARYLTERQMDGFYNDLTKPSMGCSSAPPPGSSDTMLFTTSDPGARFGRNVPLDHAFPDPMPQLLEPNPRVISRDLLARKKLIEATSLNFLAAAWIQFETHDWFNHGEPVTEDPFPIPLEKDDPWPRQPGCPMHIRRTRPDPTRDYAKERQQNGGELKYPPTYVNAESHWWDASQIYGSDHETTLRLRTQYVRNGDKLESTGKLVKDGKLYLEEDNLTLDPSNAQGPLLGFVGNWWAGLSLLHTVFAREHNAICDRLRLEFPYWDDNHIFNTARMINAALLAKIHTVEWTPAILAHPVLEIGMSANWWGLETERLYRAIGRISENEAFAGIPLSGVDHTGADYCLTEEFVSVYRMHPLMRDSLDVRSAADGRLLQTFEMMKGVVGNIDQLKVFQGNWTMADVLYSFGVCHPGAITVHNFPAFLREFRRFDGEILDLASIDIVRDRERGVPRYNAMRKFLHKKPIVSFDDLANSKHPNLPAELRSVYGQTNGKDNVDRIDLMVGLYSEEPPEGFGFSDTAFRIFILMASRRLKSDRFIAKDFTPEVYTQVGIDWVNNNSMISVILRHFPELSPALRDVTNGFKPWNDLSTGVKAGLK